MECGAKLCIESVPFAADGEPRSGAETLYVWLIDPQNSLQNEIDLMRRVVRHVRKRLVFVKTLSKKVL
jgi:hypothetical protein